MPIAGMRIRVGRADVGEGRGVAVGSGEAEGVERGTDVLVGRALVAVAVGEGNGVICRGEGVTTATVEGVARRERT